LLPAVKNKELAKGLDHLLDQIDGALPRAAAKADANNDNYMFPDHPEWRLPFVLVVFSPFALFPLFMGRWGCVVSAPMLAGFYGGAAWGLWDSTTAALAIAGAVFPLPLLWALNWSQSDSFRPWLRYAKAIGNLIGVALFFAVITLFVGAGLSAAGADEVWAAPIFAGLLAIGVAVFLFPGEPAQYLMIVLRSAVHFAFILTVAYVALQPFMPHPAGIAFAAAGAVTACAALGLYLDSRERTRTDSAQAEGIRWSRWFFGLALLVALPFGLLALVLAAVGEDIQTRLAQAAAGGGSIAGVLSLAARYGLFAAVKIGLGGRFGGGGAGRSE
jgi:hypothetical protein